MCHYSKHHIIHTDHIARPARPSRLQSPNRISLSIRAIDPNVHGLVDPLIGGLVPGLGVVRRLAVHEPDVTTLGLVTLAGVPVAPGGAAICGVGGSLARPRRGGAEAGCEFAEALREEDHDGPGEGDGGCDDEEGVFGAVPDFKGDGGPYCIMLVRGPGGCSSTYKLDPRYL
jgi:hypothetical protein